MLYINNIAVSDYIIKQINNKTLNAQISFANGKDTHIVLNVPEYDDVTVAQIYMMERARVTNNSCDCMLKIWSKYPCYVTISNTFIYDKEKLDTILEDANDDFITENLESIITSIYKHENIKHIITCTGEKHAYINCSSHKMLKFMDKMYDVDAKIYIPIPEYTIDGDRLCFHEHPYGRTSQMTEVTSTEHLNALISNDEYMHLYINTNIEAQVGQLYKHISHIPASAFKTWQLGPKCHKLEYLFKYYNDDPQIGHWNVAQVNSIIGLFHYCYGVRDLSMLKFAKHVDARYAFAYSGVTKSPHFAPTNCTDMFENCMYLTELNITDTTKITSLFNTFVNCISLRRAFDNCNFESLLHMHDTFRNCTSLRRAFNNCNLSKLSDIKDAFDGCTSLESAFNNCKTTHFINGLRAFQNCISLQNVFNDCTSIALKGTTFIHCLKLKTITGTKIHVHNLDEYHVPLFKYCPNIEFYDIHDYETRMIECEYHKIFKGCSKMSVKHNF